MRPQPTRTGYLAGPMTVRNVDGTFNYAQFHLWARIFRAAGHRIHNPAEHFDGDVTRPRADYIRAAVEAVLDSDYLILLPGWEASPGANLEIDIAIELGLQVFELRAEDEAHWRLKTLRLKTRAPRSVR